MAALTKKEMYPKYYKRSDYLSAIVSPTEMYKVSLRGSNMNEGLTIDHYITRKMVLKYYERGKEISAAEFKILLTRLYQAYIEKIVT